MKKIITLISIFAICNNNISLGNCGKVYDKVYGIIIETELIDTTIYTKADIQPEFNGGLMKLYKFLGENIKYPVEAANLKKEGRVFVKFVVDSKGKVQNPVIVKSAGYGMDEEALRVIALLPRWIPGKVNRQPVSCYFTMPISFKLD